jgi:hypothetical protein
MSARWGSVPNANPPPTAAVSQIIRPAVCSATAPISAIFQSNFGRELFYDAADSILDTEDLILSELDVVEPGGEGP